MPIRLDTETPEGALGYIRLAFNNRIPVSTITCSGAASGFSADNVGDQNRNTYYKPDSTSATHWIKFQFTEAKAIDFLALLSHNFKASGITNVYLKCATTTDDGAHWETYAVNNWQPGSETSDFDIFFSMTTHTRIWWLLVFDVAGTAPLLGEVFLGQSAQFDFSWPDERTYDHGVDIVESPSGHVHAEQYGMLRELISLQSSGGTMTDTQRATLVALDAWAKNGLNPICLMDVDTEAAKGLCKYGRLYGPLTVARQFIDANDTGLIFKQEL